MTDPPTIPDSECTNALLALTNAVASCTPTPDNPTIICTGECRDNYQDIFENCSPTVSDAMYN